MMAKKKAVPTPTPQVKGGKTQQNKYDQAVFQQNLFIAMALNMSWQLAIVVIIPLVGGYKIDEHFNTLPVFTLIGLLVAFAGTGMVLYRVVGEAKSRALGGQEDKK
jgi:F0F1-type ATP synthase assembly protein I